MNTYDEVIQAWKNFFCPRLSPILRNYARERRRNCLEIRNKAVVLQNKRVTVQRDKLILVQRNKRVNNGKHTRKISRFFQDAYHSLSIEGYKVTDELIEKVRSGNWQPDTNASDSEQRNAMAARGYWQAFQAVKESIRKILAGRNSGEVADTDHRGWYRELFAPSVAAGLLKPSNLAGYRYPPLHGRQRTHCPLSDERDADFGRVSLDGRSC
jgi:hypothetical protein